MGMACNIVPIMTNGCNKGKLPVIYSLSTKMWVLEGVACHVVPVN